MKVGKKVKKKTRRPHACYFILFFFPFCKLELWSLFSITFIEKSSMLSGWSFLTSFFLGKRILDLLLIMLKEKSSMVSRIPREMFLWHPLLLILTRYYVVTVLACHSTFFSHHSRTFFLINGCGHQDQPPWPIFLTTRIPWPFLISLTMTSHPLRCLWMKIIAYTYQERAPVVNYCFLFPLFLL